MDLVVNGETRQEPEGATVAGLLDRLGLGKQACAVEVNKRLVPKREHGEHRLAAGDRVEIITLVGGG